MKNKMAITTYVATSTLSVNELNAPIKGQGGQKRKQDTYAAYKRLTSD